jgi:hypothetical protein
MEKLQKCVNFILTVPVFFATSCNVITMVIIIDYLLIFAITIYSLLNENFSFAHCTCYFRNGERLENGEWSYSTPRVFEEFQQKFPDFLGTYQQLAQKVKKDLHFFPYRVSVVHEIKPLDNKSPHNITSLNIDRFINKLRAHR